MHKTKKCKSRQFIFLKGGPGEGMESFDLKESYEMKESLLPAAKKALAKARDNLDAITRYYLSADKGPTDYYTEFKESDSRAENLAKIPSNVRLHFIELEKKIANLEKTIGFLEDALHVEANVRDVAPALRQLAQAVNNLGDVSDIEGNELEYDPGDPLAPLNPKKYTRIADDELKAEKVRVKVKEEPKKVEQTSRFGEVEYEEAQNKKEESIKPVNKPLINEQPVKEPEKEEETLPNEKDTIEKKENEPKPEVNLLAAIEKAIAEDDEKKPNAESAVAAKQVETKKEKPAPKKQPDKKRKEDNQRLARMWETAEQKKKRKREELQKSTVKTNAPEIQAVAKKTQPDTETFHPSVPDLPESQLSKQSDAEKSALFQQEMERRFGSSEVAAKTGEEKPATAKRVDYEKEMRERNPFNMDKFKEHDLNDSVWYQRLMNDEISLAEYKREIEHNKAQRARLRGDVEKVDESVAASLNQEETWLEGQDTGAIVTLGYSEVETLDGKNALNNYIIKGADGKLYIHETAQALDSEGKNIGDAEIVRRTSYSKAKAAKLMSEQAQLLRMESNPEEKRKEVKRTLKDYSKRLAKALVQGVDSNIYMQTKRTMEEIMRENNVNHYRLEVKSDAGTAIVQSDKNGSIGATYV
ncbi:hypothetical protein GF340_06185 [Candidatus Peregrinibacteria bacterium]|nr:hypothetical protein [Candidatus Peregrinibacteria bacterium]